jgi:hypothetical protein
MRARHVSQAAQAGFAAIVQAMRNLAYYGRLG